MQMKLGFDVISDLKLTPDDSFNWEGKATSLYCIIAGNISSDLRTIVLTLSHLTKFYQGVFYVIGQLEYEGSKDIEARTNEILKATKRIKNLAVLHHHVVIIDGVAILGCNGWYGIDSETSGGISDELLAHQVEDVFYLKNSVEKLQKHLDVTKIFLVTSSVPGSELYFGEEPNISDIELAPNLALSADTQSKITNWIFGTYKKTVDTSISGINYVCNPYGKRNPYWAKRLEVEN